MPKKAYLSRRDFMRMLMAAGFSAATAGTLLSLTGCNSQTSSEATAQPSTTTQPAATATTANARRAHSSTRRHTLHSSTDG